MLKRNTLLRHEYFLNDYISKIGNYSVSQFKSSLGPELWLDGYYNGTEEMKAKTAEAAMMEKSRRNCFPKITRDSKEYRRLDFSFIPDYGFLGSMEPMLKNVELKLCFDREPASLSIVDYDSAPGTDHSILDNPWTIKECHAVVEYVSSPDLRALYETIQSSPMVYNYDDSEVLIRSLPKGDTNIRIDAIHGGPIPSHLFAALIPSSYLTGDRENSATIFEQHGVKEFNININGHSVNGYPVKCAQGAATYPLLKWVESTNRLHNNIAGESLSLANFHQNFIWSHYFETEETANGWITLDFKLETAYTINMSLVIWIIQPMTLTIDRYNQVEKSKI